MNKDPGSPKRSYTTTFGWS